MNVVASLSFASYLLVFNRVFHMDKGVTTQCQFVFYCVYYACMILIINHKFAEVNLKISLSKVAEWLGNHPKSPWWINNCRIADYCKIPGDKKHHNTTILGKFLPRDRDFFA